MPRTDAKKLARGRWCLEQVVRWLCFLALLGDRRFSPLLTVFPALACAFFPPIRMRAVQHQVLRAEPQLKLIIIPAFARGQS